MILAEKVLLMVCLITIEDNICGGSRTPTTTCFRESQDPSRDKVVLAAVGRGLILSHSWHQHWTVKFSTSHFTGIHPLLILSCEILQLIWDAKSSPHLEL